MILPIIVYFRATLELNNETVANGTGIDMVATYTCNPGFAFTGKFLYNHEHFQQQLLKFFWQCLLATCFRKISLILVFCSDVPVVSTNPLPVLKFSGVNKTMLTHPAH